MEEFETSEIDIERSFIPTCRCGKIHNQPAVKSEDIIKLHAKEIARHMDQEIINILAGEQIVEDFGGYEESTLEKLEAFRKKRNYPI
jgi:ABC-type Fe2+-enterobactin transport system substrate-binding protein